MKARGLVVVFGFFFACSFATLASAKGGGGTGFCSGTSATTIKKAQASAIAYACTEAQNCAANQASTCKDKKVIEATLKGDFVTLMTTYNIGPLCAGAIIASVLQPEVDGKTSALSACN